MRMACLPLVPTMDPCGKNATLPIQLICPLSCFCKTASLWQRHMKHARVCNEKPCLTCIASPGRTTEGRLPCNATRPHVCRFWDWKSGNRFQEGQTIVQPGSLESEAGIYAASFDVSGSRLITAEADKTIKFWKEDQSATPETHPVNFRPPKDIRRY